MSGIELQIEPLKSEQISEIITLDEKCLGGLWTTANYEQEINNPKSTILVLCVPSINKIIGYGSFWAILEEAHITILAVSPEYQGQGLGQLILCTLLQQAVIQNLERATLEVKENNPIALALYEKLGFKIAGRRPGYYQKTQEAALILWRGDLQKATFAESLKQWNQENQKRLAKKDWHFQVRL